MQKSNLIPPAIRQTRVIHLKMTTISRIDYYVKDCLPEYVTLNNATTATTYQVVSNSTLDILRYYYIPQNLRVVFRTMTNM